MKIQHLPRWTWASVSKHFDDRRQTLPMFVEGHDRLNNQVDGLEFRMNGPRIQEVSSGYWIVDLEINVLVMCIKDDLDQHKLVKSVGIATAAFTNMISVFKYGTGLDDDQSLVGCLILQTDRGEGVTITNFGQVQDTNNVLVSTVEARYRMDLSER